MFFTFFEMKNWLFSLLLLGILVYSCKDDIYEPIEEPIEERTLAGGATTYLEYHSNAYSMPAPNLSASELQTHLLGDVDFENVFVTAPSTINAGLGPIFNNNSCIQCHPRDGRARFPDNFDLSNGFFLRTSIPGVAADGGPVPTPGFGHQIQNQGIFGYQPEAKVQVTFEYKTETLADGTVVELRKPVFSVKNPYIPFPANAMLSPRMSMPVFGLGLVEAIPESRILSLQDTNDNDGDGISGKANMVWDPYLKQTRLGRFGWKANTPSVLVQSAGAYVHDMGVTNYVFPFETGINQTNGNDGLNDDPDIPDHILNQVVHYCRTLAVPAARNIKDKNVNNGYKLFVNELQCAKCHTPSHTTGTSDISALAYQKIWPFSDFLLHDMGADLADNRPDFLADGFEWRTRPLWGIGLTHLINNHHNFLHDGRARNLTEAILWHGGEAENSKQKFKHLSSEKRNDLLAFLESL